MKCSFFFNDTSTTEIYTTDTLFPYTTLFRARLPRRLLDGEADHIEGEADRHDDPFLVHKVLGPYVVACGERVVERHRHVEGLTDQLAGDQALGADGYRRGVTVGGDDGLLGHTARIGKLGAGHGCARKVDTRTPQKGEAASREK